MTGVLATLAERGPYLGLAFVAVVLVCVALNPPVRAWFERRRVRALRAQRRLNLERPVPFSIYGAPLLGFVVAVAFSVIGAWFVGLIIGYIVFRLLDSLTARQMRKRALKFDEQFVDALQGMANSLKAGMSLPQSVGQVATDMPPPVSQEFGDIVHEYNSGKTIGSALDDARARIQSRNFDLAVQAFKVGVERGGNVAQVFEKIAASIREIWRLQEHIRTVTTEGRSSARFMTVMPGVFMVLLYVMDPDGITLLFTTTVGLVLLSVVVVMNLLAHLWIRRILDVDV